MRVESMRLSLASRVSVGSQRLCDRVLHWARVPVRPGARDRPGSATAIARAAAFTRSEATSSVHEARLKQRPPAAVSCVERRAHVHGWSSDSAVVHEEREVPRQQLR